MDFEKIRLNEASNDGQTVYMYYNKEKQCYEAFGLSAYYADMAACPELSFSEEIQLPMATFSRQDVLDVRQSMTMLDHKAYDFYVFRTRSLIGDAGYDRWKKHIL
jgi:hypothetical protein